MELSCNNNDNNYETQMIESCLSLMYDFINENPTEITEEDFEDNMIDCIYELLNVQFEQDFDFFSQVGGDCLTKVDDEIDLDLVISASLKLFYIHFIPKRSFSGTFILQHQTHKQQLQIKEQLNYLKNKKQPQQRTPEWYEFRKQHITASNAYKVFESQSCQNQLIFEKCNIQSSDESGKSMFSNVNSSLHWGQKYEPVSAMLYEDIYSTKLMDLGCIQHPRHSFLAASPDGLNCLENSDRFGRMLEIKNIVNREITGCPKKEYWIQMQLQMEVCDLNETDFLECRFKEYENYIEFLEDGTFFVSENAERKGIIMYFADKTGNPIYQYKPLHMGCKEFKQWEEEQIEEKKEQGITWIHNLFWRLDEISCVLVLRNKKWFNDNIQQLENLWNIVERERISGYEHREPKRRSVKEEKSIDYGCLIKINKLSGKTECL